MKLSKEIDYILPINLSFSFRDYKNLCKVHYYKPRIEIYKKIVFAISHNYIFPEKYNFNFYLDLLPKNKIFHIYFLDFIATYFYKHINYKKILKAFLAFHETDYESTLSDLKIPNKSIFSLIKKFFNFSLCVPIFLFILTYHYTKFIFKKKIPFSSYKNKSFLILGGSSQLGEELLRFLLIFDAKIHLTYHNSKLSINHLTINDNFNISIEKRNFEKLDITKFKNITFVNYIFYLSALKKKLLKDDYDLIQKHFMVNFFTPIQLLNKKNINYDKLILISSMGRYHGMINSYAYNSSKAALSTFVEGYSMTFKSNIFISEPGILVKRKIGNIFNRVLVQITYSKFTEKLLLSIHNEKKYFAIPLIFKLISTLINFLPLNLKKKIFEKYK